MKLLVFSDVHASIEALERVRRVAKREKPDLIVCCGDWTIFGEGMEEMFFLMNDLSVPVLVITGNHEDVNETRETASHFPNIIFKHKQLYRHEGFVFVCYGGGGFSRREPHFVSWAAKAIKEVKKGEKLVLVTHGPPANTKLDLLFGGMHCGNVDYEAFIKRYKPKAVLCGHIHESQNNYIEKGTHFVNPGPYGVIIEL